MKTVSLKITLSRRFFAQVTPRNCLKFMFTPRLPNHAGCQIDYSQNNPIFPTKFPFHALKYVESCHHAFPLGNPDKVVFTATSQIWVLNRRKSIWASLRGVQALIVWGNSMLLEIILWPYIQGSFKIYGTLHYKANLPAIWETWYRTAHRLSDICFLSKGSLNVIDLVCFAWWSRVAINKAAHSAPD